MAKAVIPAERLATASEPTLSHGAYAHSLLIAKEAFDALLKAHCLGSGNRYNTLHHLGAYILLNHWSYNRCSRLSVLCNTINHLSGVWLSWIGLVYGSIASFTKIRVLLFS